MLFPVVTTFETAGTYKNDGQTPPTLHMHGMRYYLVHVPLSLYIYTYTVPARICTPLIVFHSLLFCAVLVIQFDQDEYTGVEGESVLLTTVLNRPADREITITLTTQDNTARGKNK